MPRHLKLLLVSGAAFLVILAVFLLPSLPQDPDYHLFADRRRFLGMPHFWNVVSNLPFLVLGWFGLRQVAGAADAGWLPELRANYRIFFLGVMGIGCGSISYHLNPTNWSLMWDRLPMTVAFMAFFSIIIGEQIAGSWGKWLLWPLLCAGIFAVVYWYATENRGRGDLRPYVLIQFLPLLIIPLLLFLFRSRLSGVGYLWGVLGAYAASKAAEVLDAEVFRALAVTGGHAVKHLLAAAGAAIFLLALKRRRPARVDVTL